MKKLGIFEVRVLYFAAKHKLMTKELALYTANLASQLKSFDRYLYETLVLSYGMYEAVSYTHLDVYKRQCRRRLNLLPCMMDTGKDPLFFVLYSF